MLCPHFTPFPEIQTDRLLLRRMTINDAKEIFFLRSSDEVMKYIDKEKTAALQDAEIYINKINDSINSNNGIMWGITFKNNPKKIFGYIGYWRLIKENYRAEVGYLLHPLYWRKGIMKEALLRVIDFGFKDMQLHSIEANINPSNAASARLLQATGFVQEAYFKEDYFFNGKFYDTVIYSKLQ